MILCPVCQSETIKKNGSVTKEIMTKGGKKKVIVQKYKCHNMHVFKVGTPPSFDNSFIEHVVYVYLRCLSLNTTIDIVREQYEEDVLSKQLILDFIERVADVLPTLDEVDALYEPKRSGYFALDGVWFSYNETEIVLLVCFDPETFDIVGALWQEEESYEGYKTLLLSVLQKIPKEQVKGVYGDGDKGLLKALNELLPTVPFQLCVVHKELKMGKTVPVKSVSISRRIDEEKKAAIKEFQILFRNCLYADTKETALSSLKILKDYAYKSDYEMFLRAYRSLASNFTATLTHFDHPGMGRDNNILECFNGIIKPRLDLMKGFKKQENLDRYLKLFLLEFRFRPLRESSFKERRGQTPLQLGDVYLPKYYNFIRFLREHFNLNFS